LQGGHLALERGIAEGELVLLGLLPFRNSLLAGEFIGEFAESGGVVAARGAICGRLLQRVEGAGERALRLPGDRGFVGGTQAGIVGDTLELRREAVAELLLPAEELLIECVDAGELLVGHFARDVLLLLSRLCFSMIIADARGMTFCDHPTFHVVYSRRSLSDGEQTIVVS
jgi:hypothetical protein